MNIKGLGKVCTRFAGKAGLCLKKNAPTLLMIGAAGAAVTGTVIACKQTLKLGDILEPHKEEVAKIKEKYENAEDKKEYGKELTKQYVKTTAKVAKLYSAPAAIMVGGFAMAGFSHKMMLNRNSALTAGLASATTAFKKYRDNVKKEVGEEADRRFLTGVTKKEVEVPGKDKDGNDILEKKTLDVVDKEPEAKRASLYTFFFDPASREWVKDAQANKAFLVGRQSYFNELLQKRGYVFLNEVLHELDIPIIAEGQMVGWYYDPDNPDAEGDNYIDFGIFDVHSPAARDFVNGYEVNAFLDFNCDGNILKHMKYGFPCDHVRK